MSLESPDSMSAEGARQLQRLAGNRAVQRLLASRAVQAKLTVGPAGDAYEQEADRVAAEVMHAPQIGAPAGGPAVQPKQGVEEDEDRLQTKLAAGITPLVQRQVEAHEHGCSCAACNAGAVQRHADDDVQRAERAERAPVDPGEGFDVGGEIESQIEHPGAGAPLPEGVRSFMEPRFGADFSGVRIHADSGSAALNRQLHAEAFTHGQDIYMGADKYAPGSTTGRRLLAHELTHVVQQTGGKVQAKYARRKNSKAFGDPALQRQALVSPVIQRHSSWEHKLLGDVDPDSLSIIGAGRDFLQAEKTGAQSLGGKLLVPTKDGQTKQITKDNVEHVLLQEIDRLNAFKKAPPQAATPEAVAALHEAYFQSKEEREGPTWTDKAVSGLKSAGTAIGEGLLAGAQGLAMMGSPMMPMVPYAMGPQMGMGVSSSREVAASGEGSPAPSGRGVGNRTDPTWQVRLVEIVHEKKDKSGKPRVNVVTYGEMNTLADIYGSTEEIRKTDPDNCHEIIQGVRQQTLFKLMDLYEEISGKNLNAGANFLRVGEGFDDAAGSTGRGPGLIGELRLMAGKSKLKDDQGKDKASTSYSAGLARNACHFAPDSWHAWAQYHRDARAKADEAYSLRQKAAQEQNQETKKKHNEDARRAENEALVLNGFGDHYLQDSYAAGHLINKTEVMKWYVKWLDQSFWRADYSFASDWEKIQQIAYNQPEVGAGTGSDASKDLYQKSNVGKLMAKDPQTVENMQGGMEDRFKASGLNLPQSAQPGTEANRVLVAWQKAAGGNDSKRTQAASDLAALSGVSVQRVTGHADQMVKDAVAQDAGTRREGATLKFFGGTKVKLYKLADPYLPKNAKNFNTQAGQMATGNAGAAKSYREAGVKVTYDKYFTFMNHKTLQLSTNILHNYFCENGLYVKTGAGETPYKIYGDDNMLQQASSKGVLESAKTANMSRDEVYEVLASGAGAVPDKTATIAARFPSHLVWQGKTLSLADWHRGGALEKFCESDIFPQMKTFLSGSGLKTKFLGTFTGNKLESEISKDESAAHDGQPF